MNTLNFNNYIIIAILIIFHVWYVDSFCKSLVGNGTNIEIIVGGYKYDQFKRSSRFLGINGVNEDTRTKLKYPFGLEYPTVQLAGSIESNYSNTKEEIDKYATESFKGIFEEIPNFNNLILIQWSRESCNYVFIFWNEERTLLYANFPKVVENSFYFSVSPNLDNKIYFKDLSSMNNLNNTFIYDIKNPVVRKVGCSNEYKVNDSDQLEISQTIFQTYGGEYFWIRGPCQMTQKYQLEITQITKDKNPNKFQIKMSKMNNDTKKQFSYFPVVWIPGRYKVQMTINQNIYQVDIEIQRPKKFTIEIFDKEEINAGLKSLDEVHLKLNLKNESNENKNYTHLFMYILKYDNGENLERIDSIKCYGSTVNCTIKASDITISIDLTKQLAFFYYVDQNFTSYSDIINLLWVVRSRNNSEDSQLFDGTLCKNYLSRTPRNSHFQCPFSLNRTKTIITQYKPIQGNQTENIECFEEFSYQEKERKKVCCYKDNMLINGASYVLSTKKDSQLWGSQQWSYSSSLSYAHFLNDRLPLIMCCTNLWSSSRKYDCYNYWINYHYVVPQNTPSDMMANLFGDPHILGFNVQKVAYTYFYTGFYDIVKINNNITIYGLFKNGVSSKYTLLQFLVIKFLNNRQIEILPVYGDTNIPWTITMRRENETEVVNFPFLESDLAMELSSQNQISINMRMNESHYGKILLDRFYTIQNPFVYMNMKFFINIPYKSDMKLYGLFGHFTGSLDNIKFERRDGNFIVNNKDIATWNISSSEIVLSQFSSESIKLLNTISTYQYKSPPKHVCGNIYCQIDMDNYNLPSMAEATSEQLHYKTKFDELFTLAKTKTDNCPVPVFYDWSFNSTDTSIGTVLNVTKCLNPQNILNPINSVILECKNGTNAEDLPKWNINGNDLSMVCSSPSTSTTISPIATSKISIIEYTTTTPLLMTAQAIGITIGILLFALIILILIYLVMRKKRKYKISTNFEMNQKS